MTFSQDNQFQASQSFDLVIVGGGIVGCSTALAASKMGAERPLKIALIEASIAPDYQAGEHFDPRVVALSKKSQQFLNELGVWSAIASQRACPYTNMHVWDAEGTGKIDFDCRDVHDDSLGAIVENSLVVHELNQALFSAANVSRFQPKSVRQFRSFEGRGELVLDDGQIIHAPLVIGADGRESDLRQLAQIGTREWPYNQTAIVTTVKVEKSHQFAAWQRFTLHGPLAFLPLTRDGQDSQTCSIVWSIDNDQVAQIQALDDSAFCAALGRAFEYQLGQVEWADKRHSIPLIQRHAKTYIAENLALVGDAAHAIHPLAGQGVNLGLYDVQVLNQELTRATQRHVPLNDASICKRYERQRQGHNLGAMAAMEAFKRLFGSDNLAVRWARNTGMNVFNDNYVIKKQLAKVAAGHF